MRIDVSQDPALLLLGLQPKDASSYYIEALLNMFMAALFKITRNWKQAQFTLSEKWKNIMWQIYIIEYYPDVKKIKKFAGK